MWHILRFLLFISSLLSSHALGENKENILRLRDIGLLAIKYTKENDVASFRKLIIHEGVQAVNTTPLLGIAPDKDMVRFLVNNLGADVNQANPSGATAVFHADQEGRMALVKYMVEELGADVHLPNKNGITVLSVAAQEGHVDIVRYLRNELNVDVNQASNDGVTPVLYAAQQNRIDVLRCLVMELGADVNYRT
jgi:ankyrin repeat protein